MLRLCKAGFEDTKDLREVKTLMAILKEASVTRRKLEEDILRRIDREYTQAVVERVEGILEDFEKTKLNEAIQLLRSEFLELLRRHEHMLKDLVRRQDTTETLLTTTMR